MFNATCLIKTDIDTVNKCMGQNPYNPETFLQNFTSRLTSFDDPLLNIYPTSEIAGNIEDEDVILGLREPQKLIEWAKTMKERAQCMAMAEFSAALQKHKAEGIDITKPMYGMYFVTKTLLIVFIIVKLRLMDMRCMSCFHCQ